MASSTQDPNCRDAVITCVRCGTAKIAAKDWPGLYYDEGGTLRGLGGRPSHA